MTPTLYFSTLTAIKLLHSRKASALEATFLLRAQQVNEKYTATTRTWIKCRTVCTNTISFTHTACIGVQWKLWMAIDFPMQKAHCHTPLEHFSSFQSSWAWLGRNKTECIQQKRFSSEGACLSSSTDREQQTSSICRQLKWVKYEWLNATSKWKRSFYFMWSN